VTISKRPERPISDDRGRTLPAQVLRGVVRRYPAAVPACRGGPGNREHLLDDGVIGVTATRKRLQRRGVDTAVLDEAVINVDADT